MLTKSLRFTEYELTPNHEVLRQKGKDMGEVRQLVIDSINHLFGSPEDSYWALCAAFYGKGGCTDGTTGFKHALGDGSARVLQLMEKDRWIGRLSCPPLTGFDWYWLAHDAECGWIVRNDSSVGFLRMAFGTRLPKELLMSGVHDPSKIAPSAVWFCTAWWQSGAISCLFHAADARFAASQWQIQLEETLHKSGFGIRRLDDVCR